MHVILKVSPRSIWCVSDMVSSICFKVGQKGKVGGVGENDTDLGWSSLELGVVTQELIRLFLLCFTFECVYNPLFYLLLTLKM